jgi:hypothetical protein
MQEPSVPEKEEGLAQYQPFVGLPSIAAISMDQVIGGGVREISSIPTHLESTTLVLGFGGSVCTFPYLSTIIVIFVVVVWIYSLTASSPRVDLIY